MAIEDKKRKHKHEKKEKKDKSHKKHKSSKIVQVQSEKKPASSVVSSSFSEVNAKLYLHLAPMWSGKVMDGVNEQLNAFLMKYVPEVDGIILAHTDVQLLTEKATILFDSPFSHFFVHVKFLVWKPKKGTKLVGRINLQSQDHIGLLIYGTFNASIPRSRISKDLYEWKASETNEEEEVVDNDAEEETAENYSEERKRSQYGEWINKQTGASIGQDDASLEFTVVDIIEANDILTVTGSLL
ncbi:uncharacterized protein BYT42DRAFT_550615 [Radiomyces spectabilis]|uniref:uncharacterized protein n=1 Tax=Radiomyces spectabilis TaxID=64574 RepID=UPI00221FD0EA|nr:uncharacterized protein BYT42DRAFT_550615 [Radiomyces spectabilis]KAI8393316.1 hypothetical protein BYT42DRAFT_550615 [Radiomyces spectabilis]